MRCLYSSVAYKGGTAAVSAIGTVERDIAFTKNEIQYYGKISAEVQSKHVSNLGTTHYVRGGGKVDIYVGTIHPLFKIISNYKKMGLTFTGNSPIMTIRTGTENDNSTTTNTATVLCSGTNPMEFKLDKYNPYFVIGNTISSGYYGSPAYSSGVQAGGFAESSIKSANLEITTTIFEIWLE